jgi:hypothetical protein
VILILWGTPPVKVRKRGGRHKEEEKGRKRIEKKI